MALIRTDGADTFVSLTELTYDDEPAANWRLGRVSNARHTEYLPGHSDPMNAINNTGRTVAACSDTTAPLSCQRHEVHYHHHATRRFVARETVEPGNAVWTLITDYTPDAIGNVDLITTRGGPTADGTAIASRSDNPGYDSQGRGMTSFGNALNQSWAFTHDTRHGQ